MTVRRRGAVERSRHDRLADALGAARRAVGSAERAEPVSALGREYAPVSQVVLRAELRGPGLAAGIDVRGDGSVEAYVGRWRRRVVEAAPGEDAVQALGRALGSSDPG